MTSDDVPERSRTAADDRNTGNPTIDFPVSPPAPSGFLFTDLGELDALIRRWEDERELVLLDNHKIREGYGQVWAPAGDPASVRQVEATQESMRQLLGHSDAMVVYVERFVGKLRAARAAMEVTEAANAARLRA